MTFYQRRDCGGIRCSDTPFWWHFGNAATAAESVPVAQRSRCSISFLIWPVTNDAALVMGFAAAHCGEDVLPTTRLWLIPMQWNTTQKTFYQRRDCGGICCSGSPCQLYFANAVRSAESVPVAQRSSCSVPLLIWPVTNDAVVVTDVAAAHRR
jgi:hypothetical protein